MQLTYPAHPNPLWVRASAVLALAVLVAGCSADTDDSAIPGVTHPVTATEPPASTPTATATEASEDPAVEPTAVIEQSGRTRILHYGDVEVDATPEDDGVLTKVTVHNRTDHTNGYQITISIGGPGDWLASSTFRLDGVAAGAVRSSTDTVGGPHLGPIPTEPKIYVDTVATY
ncbi:hypothetical protein [Streptomyces sp. NPDC047000]|uniref:hypothetical protein n=1 Tax=Streptomyces sp. NPDC047000 TaxID=3155474 RepID=UPI0033DECAAB